MKTKAHALISAACPEFAIRIVEDLEREVAAQRKAYLDVADAVTRESTGPDDVCRQARATRAENAKMRRALQRLRDCDWVITPLDRMDAVRDIAREALTP